MTSFYTPTNTAQRIVKQSLTDPNADWPSVCAARGAAVDQRGVYHFPDGSAVAFTASRLPVEYVNREGSASPSR
jgi:hypothetical protein